MLRIRECKEHSLERGLRAVFKKIFAKLTQSNIIAFFSLQISPLQALTSEQALDLSAMVECTSSKQACCHFSNYEIHSPLPLWHSKTSEFSLVYGVAKGCSQRLNKVI